MRNEALEYHKAHPRGKISVLPTKPHSTSHELSLAYSPGVAYPCLEIEKNEKAAYKYTAKGNLVAVISNGTAVLGLGNIGALASKPVMEGKGLLLKTLQILMFLISKLILKTRKNLYKQFAIFPKHLRYQAKISKHQSV